MRGADNRLEWRQPTPMRESRALTPELHQKLTAWRRHLHAHPELSLQEKATAAFVQEKLTELGIPFEAGIGGHGVVATLTRGSAAGTRRPARRHGCAADHRGYRACLRLENIPA